MRAVDLGVAGGEGVGEVEFEDDVVLVGGEVDQVLHFTVSILVHVMLNPWERSYAAQFLGLLGDGPRHWLEGHGGDDIRDV